MAWVYFFALCLTSVSMVKGFSSGADPSSCSSMIPGHGTPSTNPHNYSLTLSQTAITTNQNITVTITSGGANFRGFLLRTVSSGSDVYGKFVDLSTGIKNLCPYNGAVTHSSPEPKSEVSLVWVPPKLFDGTIQFELTIVVSYSEYHKSIMSTNLLVSVAENLVSAPDCGQNKGCYPAYCNPCDFTVTWEDAQSHVEIEMTSLLISTGNKKWLGFGLSDDHYMSHSSIVMCKTFESTNEVEMGWTGWPTYEPLADKGYGLRDTLVSMADGKINCRFQRIKTPLQDTDKIFALSEPYYLMVASGNLNDTGFVEHHDNRYMTASRITFTNFSTEIPPEPIVTTTPSDGGAIQTDPECGATKGCLSDCGGSGCSYLITWQTTESNTVTFEIHAEVDSAKEMWIAIGFSGDKNMGDDNVYACLTQAGSVSIEVGNNEGFRYIPFASSDGTVLNPSGSIQESVLRCSFERTINSTNTKIFDLNRKWHLFHAEGEVFAVRRSSYVFGKHMDPPIISDVPVDFLSATSVQGSTKSRTLMKMHGIVMLFAWIFFSSVGITVARYFKPSWPDSKIKGQKVWFQIHRTCMVLATLLTIIGFVIIFIDVKGFSQLSLPEEYKFAETHPILGIVVTGLTIINPIMALFRPGPQDKSRPIFNALHFTVGKGAQLTAGVAIIFGTYLDQTQLPRSATYLAIAYVVTFIVIDLLLELEKCIQERKKAKHVNIEMKESNGNVHNDPKLQKPQDKIRKVLLLSELVAMTGFSLALVILVAIS